MTPPPNLYPLEKFGQAVSSLATGPGRIRERLMSAYLAFQPVRGDDLPRDLRGDYVWIMDMLASQEAVGTEGTVQATLNSMDESTAVEIAQRIYSLEDRLITWAQEQRG